MLDSLDALQHVFKQRTVSSMFWPPRDSSRSLAGNLGLQISRCLSSMCIYRQRRLCDHFLRMTVNASRDKLALSAIPLGQDFCRRSTSQNSGVNQASKSHSRNVSTGAVYAIKVPNSLGSLWVMLVEKAPAILPVKDSSESPW